MPEFENEALDRDKACLTAGAVDLLVESLGPAPAAGDDHQLLDRPDRPHRNVIKAHWVPVAAILIAVSLPTSSRGASGSDLFSNLFGTHMNDVAVKVAELPNPDSAIFPLGLDFSPDASRIAVESYSEKIRSNESISAKIYIWDWRNKHIEKAVEMPRGGNNVGVSNPLRYSPGGRFLAVCEESGERDIVVRIWDIANWSIAKDIEAGDGIESRGGCNGIGFTPDGTGFIRSTATDGTPGNNSLIAYATGTWQPLWGLTIPGFSPSSMAISPDGAIVAVAGTIFDSPQDVTDSLQRSIQTKIVPNVNIVDLKQRKVIRVIRTANTGPLAWSSDGKRLAIAGGPGVQVVDPLSGNELLHENLPNAAHMNVRFTSDGRFFIECDMNGRGTGLGVKVWDGQHQKLLQEISGNVGSIAVSRDGQYLAVGETGRTTIWQFK